MKNSFLFSFFKEGLKKGKGEKKEGKKVRSTIKIHAYDRVYASCVYFGILRDFSIIFLGFCCSLFVVVIGWEVLRRDFGGFVFWYLEDLNI